MNVEAGKMKKVAAILLWLSLLIVKDAASAYQEQLLPTGVARVYGYAHYMETTQLSQPIRRAKVELWEDAFIDTRLAISETNDQGYYEFNVALTGSKSVYAKIFSESYIVFVTHGIFNDIYWDRTPTNTAFEGVI